MSLCIINDITTIIELFTKTGQCSTTITKLLAELEWTVPLGETCRDYHSRFKGCCLILSGTSSQERAMVSIWKCNLAAFQRFQFSFLSLDFYCRMMRFSSPFPFSSWRPQLDAFYNCFRGNLNLFDRYIALSTIFMFHLPWFIDQFYFYRDYAVWVDRSIQAAMAEAALLKLSLSWRNQSLSRGTCCISLRTTSVNGRKFAVVQQCIKYFRNYTRVSKINII